jgi:hypothetical protein
MERFTEFVAWLKHQFHVASDKKNITYIGLVVAALSAACIQVGPEWIETNFPKMTVVCKIVAALGTFLIALGKGIGDRREVRPETEALEAMRGPV